MAMAPRTFSIRSVAIILVAPFAVGACAALWGFDDLQKTTDGGVDAAGDDAAGDDAGGADTGVEGGDCPCDPADPNSCTGGEGCDINSFGKLYCRAVGSAQQGDACDNSATFCAAGYTCVAVNGTDCTDGCHCDRWCYYPSTTAGACPPRRSDGIGTSCGRSGSGNAAHFCGQTYGFCFPGGS